MIRGYKLIPADWQCKGQKYTVDETIAMKEKPVLCEQGFHFCITMKDCLLNYDLTPDMHMCEVEALGMTEGPSANGESKYCTNKIRIVREIPFDELMRGITKYELLKEDVDLMRFIQNPTREFCLAAVKQNGDAL